MTVGTDYADDLKRELLTEMADNFFSRRRRLDERLEAFPGLREKVARQGALALARWRAFRALLLGSEAGDRFLAGLGFDLPALDAFPQQPDIRPRLRRPLGLTAAGRYRKAVLAAYDDLRQELENYNEGGYAPDPRDPRRMGRIPGYEHLVSTANALNEEIAAVNACQCPTDVLQFTKSLDPVRQEQEHACGGIDMAGACRLDAELAFKPIAPASLDAPCLPTPPPLDDVKSALAALADQLHAATPTAAAKALGSG